MRSLCSLFGLMLLLGACADETPLSELPLWDHLNKPRWTVSEFTEGAENNTALFQGYVIDFKANQVVYLTGPTEISGGWWVVDSTFNGSVIEFSFLQSSGFGFINGEWGETSRTATEVTLEQTWPATRTLRLVSVE